MAVSEGAELQAVIEQVRQAYAGLDRYADGGTLISTIGHRSKIEFVTRFERSTGRFLFEYTERSRFMGTSYLGIVSLDGVNATFDWTVNEAPEEMSLEHALASATGISHGLASLVPTLLMPEECHWLLDGMKSGELLSPSHEAENLFHRVVFTERHEWSDEQWEEVRQPLLALDPNALTDGTLTKPEPSSTHTELWIDARTGLIVKQVQHDLTADGRPNPKLREEVTFFPETNPSFSADDFKLKIPRLRRRG